LNAEEEEGEEGEVMLVGSEIAGEAKAAIHQRYRQESVSTTMSAGGAEDT
jgi:hypothetical protein